MSEDVNESELFVSVLFALMVGDTNGDANHDTNDSKDDEEEEEAVPTLAPCRTSVLDGFFRFLQSGRTGEIGSD